MGHPVVQVVFKGKVLQSVPFDRDLLRIGRSRDNDLVIDNLAVSRHHALLFLRDGQVILEDQGSENGCLVNGRHVARSAITDEDEVFIGKHQIVVRGPEATTAVDEDAPPPRRASPWDGAHTYCLLDERAKSTPTALDATPAAARAPERASGGSHGEVYAGLILQRAGRLERIVAVEGASFVLGRAPECELVLDGAGTSRRHARIVREGARFFLEDLGSANGTLVNGTRTARRALEVGDELRIDEFQLTFVLESRPLGEEIRVESTARSGGPPVPPEQTLVGAAGAPRRAAGAAPSSGELFGCMDELTPTPAEPPSPAPGRSARPVLEVELDPEALPPGVRAALEAALDGELRLPATLRLRRG
jgi:pSer/pThr/pTyr-binding forkhead associated (FHA) protein